MWENLEWGIFVVTSCLAAKEQIDLWSKAVNLSLCSRTLILLDQNISAGSSLGLGTLQNLNDDTEKEIKNLSTILCQEYLHFISFKKLR